MPHYSHYSPRSIPPLYTKEGQFFLQAHLMSPARVVVPLDEMQNHMSKFTKVFLKAVYHYLLVSSPTFMLKINDTL